MKTSQTAYEETLVINAAVDGDVTTPIETDWAFAEIDEIAWSVGSLGYVEVSWQGNPAGKSDFTLSGNGSLRVPMRKPKESNGLLTVKFINFDRLDACMIAITGDIQ